MGNRFLDWRSSRGKDISFGFALACFMLFHSFLGNCDESMIGIVHFENRKVFLNFFSSVSFAVVSWKSLMVGVVHFEGVKVLWILFSWKIGDFLFYRSENISFEIGFFFLSFLFLCSFLGNYGILKSWWLKLFILRENRYLSLLFRIIYLFLK